MKDKNRNDAIKIALDLYFNLFVDVDNDRKICMQVISENLVNLIKEKCKAFGQDWYDPVYNAREVLEEGDHEDIRKLINYWVELDPDDPEKNEYLLREMQ